MALLVQKLIYTINIWFNVVPGSFFGQDHLLNLIILWVYAERWPKDDLNFKTETDVAQNLIDDFFSNFGYQKNFP